MSVRVPASLPAVDEQRRALGAAVPGSARPMRLLLLAALDSGRTGAPAAVLRALRALGHHVFHVDPQSHRSLLADPTAADAAAPALLDLARLAPALDRFRPHALVLCGGLAVSDRDAEDCRARGVLSVGITVGDPQDLAAAAAAAARLDVHTVPTEPLRERFTAAGAPGARLLPPAADTALLAAHVPPAPALRCDVAVLGDAATPGATALAEALAAEATVSCYGPGWAPGSAMPQGLALLQALAEAPLHVVLSPPDRLSLPPEALVGVAAGGAPLWPEQAAAGVLDAAGPSTYRHPAEVPALVRDALADRGTLEQRRRTAFAALATDHRWEFSLRSLTDELADRADPAPLGRPRTVAVAGWFGAANTGDDLILEALTRVLETRVPDVHVVVAGAGPRRVVDQHGLPAVRRTDLQAADDLARRCAAVVLGGGGLWHDYDFAAHGGTTGIFASAQGSPSGQAALPLLVRIHGGQFHVFGMGVGPLHDPDARAVVRFLAEQAQSVTVRDEPSRRDLLSIRGWRTPVTVVPDCVYGMPLGEAPVPPRVRADGTPVIAVNVRDWPAGGPRGVLDGLPAALSRLAGRHGARLVGVPMMAGDRDRLQELFATVDAPSQVLGRSADLATLVADLRQCRLVISMRLHAALLAHRAAVPVVGIAYDPKVHHHFTELGRSRFVVTLDQPATDLDAALDAALAEQGRLPAETVARIRQLEREAAEGLEALAARIAGVPVAVPSPPAIPFVGAAAPVTPRADRSG